MSEVVAVSRLSTAEFHAAVHALSPRWPSSIAMGRCGRGMRGPGL